MSDEIVETVEESASVAQGLGGPVLRSLGRWNWRGLLTLLGKEINRFLKIYPQTVFSPVLISVLFYVVFSFSPQGKGAEGEADLFPTFLASGLIMMTIVQNAFFNGSASLILSKLQGNIVDLVMAPISAFEWVLAYALAGVVRGLLVGALSLAALALVADIGILSPWTAVFFAVAGSLLMALLGFLVGLWGDSFDHVGTVQNFIIMPATFLSGTFFSTRDLTEGWRLIVHLNPFFYLTDGFRSGFTGLAESSVAVGAGLLVAMNIVLFWAAVKMVAKGTKLKK